jgi:hypothetical protein
MADQLHLYMCSFDHTVASSTVRISPMHTPIKCIRCLRIMAYKWSQPITTEAERAIAARGVVFNPFTPSTTPFTKRPCDECRELVEKDALIHLPAVGRFCSMDCADKGVAKHEAFMQRVAKVKQDMPWLDTAHKESA